MPLPLHIIIRNLLPENRRRIPEQKPRALKNRRTEIINIRITTRRCRRLREVGTQDSIGCVYRDETFIRECGAVEVEDGFDAGEGWGACAAEDGIFGVDVAEGFEVFGVEGLAEEGEELVDGGEGGCVAGGISDGARGEGNGGDAWEGGDGEEG